MLGQVQPITSEAPSNTLTLGHQGENPIIADTTASAIQDLPQYEPIVFDLNNDLQSGVQTAHIGQEVQITGKENITTGYSWQYSLDDDCDGVEEVLNEHVRGKRMLAGAPGRRDIKFKVTKSAQKGAVCSVYFKMARPWMMKRMSSPDHVLSFTIV